MKIIAILLTLIITACAIPDPQGGDNAPDVVEVVPPDAATTAKHHWEARALLECDRMCSFYNRLGCQHTSSTAWLADCRTRCYGAVYAFPDCQQQHAIVDQCRYTVGRLPLYPAWHGDGGNYVCNGGWPFLTRRTQPGAQDNCDAAEGWWRACAYDPAVSQ